MRAVTVLLAGMMTMPSYGVLGKKDKRETLFGGIPSYVEPTGGPGGRQRYANDPLQMLNDELTAAVQRGEISGEEAVLRYRAALPKNERERPPMTGRDVYRILNEEARPTAVPRLPKWGRDPYAQ
jgi:hypothetical protein